ncbi:longevity assurance proteins LAG1/LAC1, partial [Aspergillus steynii IBT 23096]
MAKAHAVTNDLSRSKATKRPHPQLSQQFSPFRLIQPNLRKWKETSLQHTWLSPLLLCLAALSLYLLNPTANNPLHACLFLSYAGPDNAREQSESILSWNSRAQYAKGPADILFVSFYALVFTFAREFLVSYLLPALARRAGIASPGKQGRFSEQLYTALYTLVSSIFGIYLLMDTEILSFSSQSPSTWSLSVLGNMHLNTEIMYQHYPHLVHSPLFKAFYLLQASFWAQQMLVLVLGLEAPRKDFRALVTHHFVTVGLIALSWRFHFTYLGVVIFVTHDASDFFLATSKLLNYLDNPLQAPYFAVFALVWIQTRHVMNLRALYSILTDFETAGPWGLHWARQEYKCRISQVITFGLLAALQGLNLFWLFWILKTAWGFLVSGGVVKDDREEDD